MRSPPWSAPDWGGQLEVIALIDAPPTIRLILEQLELSRLPARPPPAALLQGKIDALSAGRSQGRVCSI